MNDSTPIRTDRPATGGADGLPLWRGLFNAWHTGTGHHINIQHQAQALDEARLAFLIGLGRDPHERRQAGQVLASRHLRIDFQKELFAGDAASIAGNAIASAAMPQGLLDGTMIRTRDLATTMRFQCSLDLFDHQTGTPVGPVTIPETGAGAELRPIEAPDVIDPTPEMPEVWRAALEPRDCDETGRMNLRGMFNVATRALWGTQLLLGMTLDTFRQDGFGMGVVAMQHTTYRLPGNGDMVVSRSGVTGISRHSMRFRQLIRDAVRQETVATFDYVVAFFDQATGAPRPPLPSLLQASEKIRIG